MIIAITVELPESVAEGIRMPDGRMKIVNQ